MGIDYKNDELLFALDIGTRTIVGTVGKIVDGKIEVVSEKYLEHEERAMVDGQIHNINLVASTVMRIKKQLEEELNIELNEVAIAAAGRFLKTVEIKDEINININEEIKKDTIRTLEISGVKKAEEEVKVIGKGILYCVGYSVKNYYLNSYIIQNLLGHKGETIGADLICTFLPRSVIDSLYTVMDRVGLKVKNLTLEPIAAIEAAVPQKLRLLNIALVDIGAGTSDIAISKEESVSAYGMVPIAGDEITEVIAKEYLVDFNTAEYIKRNINEENISYMDVMGFENTIDSVMVKKVIKGNVDKLAKEISKKIIDLNGGKSPAAIFLVGGGAHTYGLIESLSEEIKLPLNRIGIKDRTAVMECNAENTLGSAGVTVLGILLSSVRSFGADFIEVNLNGQVISLFNAQKHKVIDALIQGGITSNMLIGKHGKSIRFNINGKKRIAFGESGENAQIRINGEMGTIESEIKEGDKIEVSFAKDGEIAKVKVSSYLEIFETTKIVLDREIVNIEPVILANGLQVKIDYIIKNNDEIKIIYPTKIRDFKEYILKDIKDIYVKGNLLEEDYILAQGEIATTKITDEKNSIKVVVNGEKITLKGKEEYIFVDIFNEINFDLTSAKGILGMELNGKEVLYTDKLNNGDEIILEWN